MSHKLSVMFLAVAFVRWTCVCVCFRELKRSLMWCMQELLWDTDQTLILLKDCQPSRTQICKKWESISTDILCEHNDICIFYVTGIRHKHLNIAYLILMVVFHNTMIVNKPNSHTILSFFMEVKFMKVNVILKWNYWVLSQGF